MISSGYSCDEWICGVNAIMCSANNSDGHFEFRILLFHASNKREILIDMIKRKRNSVSVCLDRHIHEWTKNWKTWCEFAVIDHNLCFYYSEIGIRYRGKI